MAAKTKDPIDRGMVRVLVYGTLKNGHSNHPLMTEAGAIFIGYDSVTGPYQLYDLGAIPATIDEQSTTGQERRIRGELYAINTEGLAALDLMEGHPHLYQRRKLVTDIHERRAWVYILVAMNFLHDGAEPAVAGLWHGSAEESKFWLAQNHKDAKAEEKSA